MTSMSQAFNQDQAEPGLPYFAFGGRRGFLVGNGVAQPVPRGSTASLEDRIGQALGGAGQEAVIGGALPFDRDTEDYLWLSEHLGYEIPLAPEPIAAAVTGVVPEPSAQEYAAAVARALRLMQAGTEDAALRKIVLARTLAVHAARPVFIPALLARLSEDPAATAFQVALPDDAEGCRRQLVGATPELLVEKTGRRVRSFPLAGSARRSRDPVADAAAASALAASEKDRREHAIVVEYLLDLLSPFCRKLGTPRGTGLTSTRSMWHLGTEIEGELKDDAVPSVVLAGHLHPTPAVCGLPRDRAIGLIRELEPVTRGFYAGAVGWNRANGDGAWHVAIRCAEICGSEARLYAGAGIVPGSDPKAEAAETAAKFETLLGAFGLPSAPDAA